MINLSNYKILLILFVLIFISSCTDTIENKLSGTYDCEYTIVSVSDMGDCMLEVIDDGESGMTFKIKFPITQDSIVIDSVLVFERDNDIGFERTVQDLGLEIDGVLVEDFIRFNIEDAFDEVEFTGNRKL